MRSLPRPLVAALFAIGLCAGASVFASDVVIKTSPGKPALNKEIDPEPEANLGKLAKKPALKPPLGAAGEDPMDKVRERLAQKLGVSKPAETADPNVVRVVARPAVPAGDTVAVSPNGAPEPGIHWSEPPRRAQAGGAQARACRTLGLPGRRRPRAMG